MAIIYYPSDSEIHRRTVSEANLTEEIIGSTPNVVFMIDGNGNTQTASMVTALSSSYALTASYAVNSTSGGVSSGSAATASYVQQSMGWIDADYFGFDANATNNFTAMRSLQNYTNASGSLAIRFKSGSYAIYLAQSGVDYIGGLQQAACKFQNANGIYIDASAAEFYCYNTGSAARNIYDMSLFQFVSCSNVTFKGNFRGLSTCDNDGDPDENASLRGLWFMAFNDMVTVDVKSNRMYHSVGIGSYDQNSLGVGTGNKNFDIRSDSIDTYYNVVCNDVENIRCVAKSRSIRDISSSYAHRNVYMAGVRNGHFMCESYNMNVGDACHLVTTSPGVDWFGRPYHIASENVYVYAKDLGSQAKKSQALAAIGVVSSSMATLPVVHKNITLDLHAQNSGSTFCSQSLFRIGCLGGPGHRFENIRVGGSYDARNSTTAISVVEVGSTTTGLDRFSLTLDRFSFLFNPPTDCSMLYIRDQGQFSSTAVQNCTLGPISVVNQDKNKLYIFDGGEYYAAASTTKRWHGMWVPEVSASTSYGAIATFGGSSLVPSEKLALHVSSSNPNLFYGKIDIATGGRASILTRAGGPEGATTANPGSLCMDTTNGLLYVKQTGTSTTGWKTASLT